MHPRRDVVRDIMEDSVDGPDVGAILENVRAWISALRNIVTEGWSSDHHLHAFVDVVLLFFFLVIQRDRHATFSNQVCPFKSRISLRKCVLQYWVVVVVRSIYSCKNILKIEH